MLETGSAGGLLVVDKYRRNGFGEVITAKQFGKIKELGYDYTAHVAHQNNASMQLAKRIGGQWIDNNSWIGIRPKKPPQIVPLWGHI